MSQPGKAGSTGIREGSRAHQLLQPDGVGVLDAVLVFHIALPVLLLQARDRVVLRLALQSQRLYLRGLGKHPLNAPRQPGG